MSASFKKLHHALKRQFSDPPSSPTTPRGEDSDSPRPRKKASFPSLRKGVTKSNASALILQDGKDTKCPAADDLQQQTLDQQPMRLSHFPKLPTLTVQEPSPDLKAAEYKPESFKRPNAIARISSNWLQTRPEPTPSPLSRTISARPSLNRSTSGQSFTGKPEQQKDALRPHVQDNITASSDHEHPAEHNAAGSSHGLEQTMAKRKIWVRRPGASATLVQINSEDLVDDVRDMILRKYANSLGRNFDSPDVSIKVQPRPQYGNERVLGPEESICRVLDESFPDGQYVTDALIIDVPTRRTPKPLTKTHCPFHRHPLRRPQTARDRYRLLSSNATCVASWFPSRSTGRISCASIEQPTFYRCPGNRPTPGSSVSWSAKQAPSTPDRTTAHLLPDSCESVRFKFLQFSETATPSP